MQRFSINWLNLHRGIPFSVLNPLILYFRIDNDTIF
jgi:hypothetical protein